MIEISLDEIHFHFKPLCFTCQVFKLSCSTSQETRNKNICIKSFFFVRYLDSFLGPGSIMADDVKKD